MPLFYFLVFLMCFSDPPLVSRVLGDSAFKIIGALCALYALFYLAGRRGKLPSYLGTGQARLFIFFYLVAVFSYVTKSVSRQDLLGSPILIYTSFVILLFTTVTIVDSWQRLRLVLLAAVGSVALGSVVVIREWFLFHNVLADFRPGWGLGDANYFGTSAVLCLPVGYLFLVNLKSSAVARLFLAGCLAVGLVGVMLSASRGGSVALAVAVLMIAARSRHSIRNLIALAVLVGPLAFLLPQSPVHRLLHPVPGDQEAVEARLVAWRAGLHMMAKHPLLGIGLGNFKPLMPFYADPGSTIQTMAHNAYIEIGAELGLPMLLVMLAVGFFSYRSLERVRRKARDSGDSLAYNAALGLEAGLVGYGAGAFFLSAEYQKLFWLTIFLTMCMNSLATTPVELVVEPSAGDREVSPALGERPRATAIKPSQVNGGFRSSTREPRMTPRSRP